MSEEEHKKLHAEWLELVNDEKRLLSRLPEDDVSRMFITLKNMINNSFEYIELELRKLRENAKR